MIRKEFQIILRELIRLRKKDSNRKSDCSEKEFQNTHGELNRLRKKRVLTEKVIASKKEFQNTLREISTQ